MAFKRNYDIRYLNESENLADLDNVTTARTNLGLVAGGAGDIWVEKAGDMMTGQLIFDGVATDITTVTNQNLTFKPHGSGILQLQAGSGGVSITTDAGNSDISILPHGTGSVFLNDTLEIEADGSGPGAQSLSILKFSNGDRIYAQTIVDRMFYTSDRFEVLSKDGAETIAAFNSSASANADSVLFYKPVASGTYAGLALPSNGAAFSGRLGIGLNNPSTQVHFKFTANTDWTIEGNNNFCSNIWKKTSGATMGYFGWSGAGGYITHSPDDAMHWRGENGICAGHGARQIFSGYYDGTNRRMAIYGETFLTFGHTSDVTDPRALIYYNETDDELTVQTEDSGGTKRDIMSFTDDQKIKGFNSSAVEFQVGGVLKTDLDEVGNVGVGEDDLITYSLPANTLKTKGDSIRIVAYGNFAANGANKQVKLYFGTTVIETGGVGTPNGTAWKFEAIVSFDSVGNQKAIGSALSDGTSFTDSSQYTTPSEDETGAITIKCTGEATNDNDIVQQGLIVEYLPANT